MEHSLKIFVLKKKKKKSFCSMISLSPWNSDINMLYKTMTWVQSLGWEDPLEKGVAALSSILGWKIPWTEEPGRPQSIGSQRVEHD